MKAQLGLLGWRRGGFERANPVPAPATVPGGGWMATAKHKDEDAGDSVLGVKRKG